MPYGKPSARTPVAGATCSTAGSPSRWRTPSARTWNAARAARPPSTSSPPARPTWADAGRALDERPRPELAAGDGAAQGGRRGRAGHGRAGRARRRHAAVPAAVGRPGAPRPAGALRGAGGDRPRRHGRRPQGVRPGPAADGGDQGAGPAAGGQRRRPASGSSARPGRPPPSATSTSSPSTPSTRRTACRTWSWSTSPGVSLQERLDRDGPLAAGGGPAHRHADGRRAGGGPRPGPDPPRHQAGQHPAGERRRSGSSSPTSAWPGRSTTRA